MTFESEIWETKRADSAERKLKNLRENLEKRVAALEARPVGVTMKRLETFMESIIKGLAPAVKEASAEDIAEALGPLRQEIEALQKRVIFLEGRASATREQ